MFGSTFFFLLIAAALTSLLEEPPRQQELGNAAREFARTFTWERCARLSYDL